MKFLIRIKKHQHYLYISIFLISLFFVANNLLTNKITSVTKELNKFIVQGNIKAKHKAITFDFIRLNEFIINAKKGIENTKTANKNILHQKLKLVCELAISNPNIDTGFILFTKDGRITESSFFGVNNKPYIDEIIHQIQPLTLEKTTINSDTIIKFNEVFYNRKTISYKLKDSTSIIVGYDINLIKYWKYFSENYSGEGAYLTLTNKEGVCMLHPEKKYIGTKVDSFFNNIPLQKITLSSTGSKIDELISTKVTSEYLNLEVLRYFSVVEVYDSSMILITNFPINLSLKETTTGVKQYFLWISILALCTFMLILGISRLQLQKEFSQKLKTEKEKEKLAISNEKYKQENAVLQLNQLKKKMNPHFLFNTLNSLVVLIDLNTDLSQKFVLKLAEVYRYLLENRESNLITVKEELNFLEQYFFLQEIRFKDSLHLNITYKTERKKQSLLKKIPFLALETLVENAIKHNEITKQKPLFIEILVKDEEIIVTNNYNPRKTKKQNSHHIGLNYLKNSYEFYKTDTFKTEISDNKFICYLPLLL